MYIIFFSSKQTTTDFWLITNTLFFLLSFLAEFAMAISFPPLDKTLKIRRGQSEVVVHFYRTRSLKIPLRYSVVVKGINQWATAICM